MAVRFYLHLKLWTISLDLDQLEVRVIRLLLTLFGKDQSEIPIDSRVTTAPQWVLRRDRFYFIVFKLIKNAKNQCLVDLTITEVRPVFFQQKKSRGQCRVRNFNTFDSLCRHKNTICLKYFISFTFKKWKNV